MFPDGALALGGFVRSRRRGVALAEHLPPDDENLIVALGRLGNADYNSHEGARRGSEDLGSFFFVALILKY